MRIKNILLLIATIIVIAYLTCLAVNLDAKRHHQYEVVYVINYPDTAIEKRVISKDSVYVDDTKDLCRLKYYNGGTFIRTRYPMYLKECKKIK